MNNLTPQPPVPFAFLTAGDAIDALPIAREMCLRATYHPAGGHAPKRIIPATHILWIEGTRDQIKAFKDKLITIDDLHLPESHYG